MNAEEQLKKDDAEGVHVLLAGEICESERCFRGSVGEGPARRVDELVGSFLGELGGSGLVVGLSEVDELHQVVLADDHIAGSDVEVGDLVLLEEADGVEEMREDVKLGGQGDGELPPLHFFKQRVAWHVVHQQEWAVLITFLDGMVILGQVGASHCAQIAEDSFFVPNVIYYFPPIFILWPHPWHFYQHQFLYLNSALFSVCFCFHLFSFCCRLLTVALLAPGFCEQVVGLGVEEAGGAGDDLRPTALSHVLLCRLVVVGDGDCVEDEAVTVALLGRGEAQCQCIVAEAAHLLLRDKKRRLSKQLNFLAVGVFALGVVELNDALGTRIFLPASPLPPFASLYLRLHLQLGLQWTVHARQQLEDLGIASEVPSRSEVVAFECMRE